MKVLLTSVRLPHALAAHRTYTHAKTIEHAGGIVFESVDEPEAVEHVRKYAAALDLHGELSFDYMKTADGLWMVECNARPCAGLVMMDAHEEAQALRHHGSTVLRHRVGRRDGCVKTPRRHERSAPAAM